MCGPAIMSKADLATLARDGACHLRSAVTQDQLHDIESAVANRPATQVGTRLLGVGALQSTLSPGGPLGAIARGMLAEKSRAVRAILFNKTAATNWSLAWHQDRVIVVTERINVDGFGPWTMKRGMVHVAPPFEILANMVTLRVHLDPVPMTNAPLLVAPGSHRLGRITEAEIADVVARCGSVHCLAERGDVWVYATAILHASERATVPGNRRVLQIDFAGCDLPGGLTWLGV